MPVSGHMRCLIPLGSSGSAQVVLPVGCAWKTPKGRRPRGILIIRCPNPPQGGGEAAVLSPVCQYQWSPSFGHYQKIITIIEGRNVDQLANGSLCLHWLSTTIQSRSSPTPTTRYVPETLHDRHHVSFICELPSSSQAQLTNYTIQMKTFLVLLTAEECLEVCRSVRPNIEVSR